MVDALAWAIAAAAGFPLAILSVETLVGMKAALTNPLVGALPKTTMLIPAHDEEGGIAAVVAAIARSGCDILVVADNCSDATAANARAAGAHVIERHDPSARGKGHALAFGRTALGDDPPDIVIVMDADCLPENNALALLASRAAQTGRVVQACNQLSTRTDDPPMPRISNFAFSLKNIVRQRGLMRIAGTCVLTGTGMAFPWAEFRDAPLATADSVEDLAIGLALVRAGKLPLYADDARVTSAPASGAAAVTQRTRWEHGFIATAATLAPRMLARGMTRLSWPSFWLGLHLMVPPLALTFGVSIISLMLTTALGFASTFAPAIALAIVIAVAGLAVLGGWHAVGRRTLPFKTLLRVPLYIAWKLPIYFKLARGADRRWTRTERD